MTSCLNSLGHCRVAPVMFRRNQQEQSDAADDSEGRTVIEHGHARDEFGITETLTARSLQAALTSAASFALGAALPRLVTAIAPEAGRIPLFSGISLVFFALLGGVAARTGGAGVSVSAIRVLF